MAKGALNEVNTYLQSTKTKPADASDSDEVSNLTPAYLWPTLHCGYITIKRLTIQVKKVACRYDITYANAKVLLWYSLKYLEVN